MQHSTAHNSLPLSNESLDSEAKPSQSVDGPTPQQQHHAEQLGIQLPMGCTEADANDLIAIRTTGDVQAKESHMALADFYSVRYPRYVGKRALFRRIFTALCDQQRDEELLSWYIYRVLRDLYYHRRVSPIDSPGHAIIQTLASELVEDKKVINSIRRSEDEAFLFFGERLNVDGHMVHGTSEKTYAYKKVFEAIRGKINVQQPSKARVDEDLKTVAAPSSKPAPEEDDSSLTGIVIAVIMAALCGASYYFFMHIP